MFVLALLLCFLTVVCAFGFVVVVIVLILIVFLLAGVGRHNERSVHFIYSYTFSLLSRKFS